MLICGGLLFLQATCAAALFVGGASVAVTSDCEAATSVVMSARAPAAVASAAPARSATSTGLRIFGRDRFARPEPPECQQCEQCGHDQERHDVKGAVAQGVHRVAGFRDHCLEPPDGGALKLRRPVIETGVRVTLRPDHRVVAAETAD